MYFGRYSQTRRLTVSNFSHRSTPNGRPLPRASATPVAKSPTRSGSDSEPVPDKKTRKRRTKKEMLESGGKRGKKSSAADSPPPKLAAAPANVYMSSSSSDDDDAESSKSRRKLGQKKGGKFESPSRTRPAKVAPKVEIKTEEEEDEEKISEKERSNKKTAISMIFASSKAGKNTGKSGIKVEVHHQPPPTVAPIMMSPPTVAIKSQGLHQQASLISHPSPAPLTETQVKRVETVRRRPDGRPSILCRIPLDLLGSSLRDLFQAQKENKPVETSATSVGRERRQSGCSTVSSSSSRLSYKRHRRREESIGSESGHQVQGTPAKRSKNFDSPASNVDSASLMPPPNRVFYSYMEHRRPEEEEYDVGDFARFMQVPV
jgi:hypothetical protein